MRTTQRPPQKTITRGPSRQYLIQFQLRYEATSKLGRVHGLGHTIMISSTHIVFAPVDRLEPGMIAEIAVAWPSLLEGRIRLELVLQVTVIHTRDGVAEARILAYDFRTRPDGGSAAES